MKTKTKCNYRKEGSLPCLFEPKRFLAALFFLISFSASAQQITVNSLQELLPYLKQDNADVKLAPGTYTVTPDDIVNGDFPDYTTVGGVKAYVLFLVSGNNSTYDFTDVTVNVETAVFNAYTDSYDDFFEVQITGNNNVLKNLTLVDVGSVHDYPKNGALNVCMDGSYNRIEGFHITAKGSYPYGYGDAFGKGGTYTIKHFKHSAFLIRGESNHAKDNTIIHRSYGHCMFMQAANNPKIEGCYLEGEMRSTDDMLAEEGTGTAADLIDFYTVWGYRLPAGYMKSTGEAGIRAYNAGNTVIDGVEYSRGTSNVTVLNCTIKHLRTGVTVAHATGTKYVEGCIAIGCENGYSLGSGDVVDSYADCAYGPVYASTYTTDKNYNAEITIIPAEDPYYNGSGNVAYIGGSNHNITLKSAPGLVIDQDLKIKVGGERNHISTQGESLSNQDDFTATNIVLNNNTNFAVELREQTSTITGVSGGMVTDFGTNNNLVHTAVSVGKYEAEGFSNASGVTTEITTDEGAGENVTSIEAGDWMEYEIDVPFDGTYTMAYRVASESADGDFTVSVGGEELETVSFTATGGIQTWGTVSSASPIFLSAGIQTIRVAANSSGWNFNWLDLLLECAVVEVKPYAEVYNMVGTTISTQESFDVSIFPGNSASLQPKPAVGGTWSWTGPNGFTADTRVVEFDDIQADVAGAYEVTFTNDCGQQNTAAFNITVQGSVLVEAEAFSSMSGVTTEATSDVSGVENVTSIDAGDWMEYTVVVPFSATYAFDYRVASETTDGDFAVSVDGQSIGQVTFPATGGAQTWATVNTTSAIYLTAGTHTLRLTSNAAGWNINWLELKGQGFVSPCNLPFENEGFTVQNASVDWSSGLMDITCVSSANIYVQLSETGALSSADNINVYYKLDGGALTSISESTGSLSETTAIVKNLTGSTLEVIIQGTSSSEENYYTVTNISVVETTDPFARVEAEDFDDMNGVKIGTTGDIDGVQNLGSIAPGEWSMYAGLDLTGVKSINARLASVYDDAYVEVRLDAVDGPLVGKVYAANTGAWQTYETTSGYMLDVTGIYDVYLVYQTKESPNVCNINWFQFSDVFVKPPTDPYTRFEAEINDGESGTIASPTSDVDGEEEVGSIQDGDWIKFDLLDLREADGIDVRVASATDGGTIEVRLGATDGEIVSFIDVPNTGSLSTWETVSTAIDEVDGEYDVYFVFRGAGTDLLKINWLKFTKYVNPFGRIEAEDYDGQYGSFTVGGTSDAEDNGVGSILKSIKPGHWVQFSDMDLTDVKSVSTRFGTQVGDAFIEVRVGAADGELLGTIDMYNTEGWHNWEVASGNITPKTGIYDVYFIYQTESSANVCNSNWFQFSGLEVSESIEAFARIEAEGYSNASGTATAATSDVDGEEEVASIQDSDWIMFKNVDLTDAGGLDVRVASPHEGTTIEVRLGAYDGALISTVEVPNTGSASAWETVKSEVEEMEGEYNVYLVFKGTSADLVNINWLQFTEFASPLGYYEAEDFDDMYGIDTQATSDDNGDENVGWVHNNDWIMFSEVDLTGFVDIDVRYSTPNSGCTVELRVGGVDGRLIGNVELPNTGNWSNWATVNSELLEVEGVHDVYVILKGGGGYLFNLNWLQFNQYADPFARLEAEDYDANDWRKASVGGTTDAEDNGVGSILKSIVPGDWIMFSDVDLTGAKRVSTRFGSIYDDTYVEVRTGAADGDLIGTINLYNSGGWHNWETASGDITGEVTGVHDVYFIYKTVSSANVCNSNWFEFSEFGLEEPAEPYARIEAEGYDLVNGTETITTSDEDGEEEVATVQDGDWIMFSGFEFVDAGGIDARVASAEGATIEVRLGDYAGELLSTIEVPNTGSATTWETIGATMDIADGEYDIYLVFKGGAMSLNWFKATRKPIEISTLTRLEAEDYFSQSGIEVETTSDEEGDEQIGSVENGDHVSFDVNVLNAGIYKIAYRVSSELGGNIAIQNEGEVLGTATIPTTAGTWETVISLVRLEAGIQTLEFEFNGGEGYLFDLNWMEFELSGISLDLSSKTKGKVDDNSIHTYFDVANTGTDSVALGGLTIRYWFTAEDYTPLDFWCDYAKLGKSNITSSFHKSTPARSGGYTYLELGFAQGLDLLPGTSTGDIMTRSAKSDWTAFDEADDYSYLPSGSYVENTQVTMYLDGILVWGEEPEAEATTASFVVEHKAGDANSPYNNSLRPNFEIRNTGNTVVPLSDVTMKYWFTSEDATSTNFWTDWAEMGNGKVEGTVEELETPVAGADRYLEIGFTAEDTLYSLSGSGEIRTRLANASWAAFDETDDYSYVGTNTYQANANITLYVGGELVWGTEPSGAAQRVAATAIVRPEEIFSGILLYPNPMDNKASLELAMPQAGVVGLKVISLTGRILHSELRELPQGRQVLGLDMPGLSDGIYIMNINVDGEQMNLRFVVRH
ncbi:carbohydrate-binding protein [Flammeovirgaceae bacterium SG7u.111]|nr:carbohydrate-binding protein [Flammeovirgaceae bacterium SG7u.132]WPO33886.1 carbohydrate-binding protein [Flammeovirgaceae bacterium SG7u.111]